MNAVEPIEVNDAYRVLRAVFARLAATADAAEATEAKGMAGTLKRYNLALALDKMGDALEILREIK
jgi:hypothetical protein